ncbi:TetR/AcrR family transcriptional regulator [Actinomyces howellii]|uniref:Transcriptional regulator BetI n=1 Tax=Actinomyces howellii TaxID=52771 RepID=A0A3S4RUT6_9ACTO|nr:TetR family transcriptional regulator [Actinomyces howellii]VEG25473.1 transcriptional regulator BetI [Actinomyces howellii]
MSAGTGKPVARDGATGRGGPRRSAPDGTSATRESILRVARASFLSQGFARTTIRGVAREAGVDPALVCYYFGSKGDLFAAAINPNMRASTRDRIAEIFEGDLRSAGARLVHLAVTTWDGSSPDVPFASLLRWAATDENATEAVERYVSEVIVAPLSEALVRVGASRDEARERAVLAGSQVMGLAMVRYVFRLEPLASAGVKQIVAVTGPSVQRFITGPLPPAGERMRSG